MKIRYVPKTKLEKVKIWLSFFEFEKIKTNSKGFDIYKSPYYYHNVIILRKRSIGFRTCEIIKEVQFYSRKYVRKGNFRGYVQVPNYLYKWTGRLYTKNLDLNSVHSKEDICRHIINANKIS